MKIIATSVWIATLCPSSQGFLSPSRQRPPTPVLSTTEEEATTEVLPKVKQTSFWEIGSTKEFPDPRPLTPELKESLSTNTHPEESQNELGKGIYITDDWRKAWRSYQAPASDPNLINNATGEAYYEIDEIEGELPEDLVGVLYRNGAGKLGVGEERVAHVLDADGLIFQINIGPPVKGGKRKVTFRSKFVQTKGFLQELEADKVVVRGVFGTAPRGLTNLFRSPRKGINEEPSTPPLISQVAANFLNTDIKNTANTHVISFGGKLLALFEAGRPYALDPETLDTIGEDSMGGILGKEGSMSMKMSSDIPKQFVPDFLNGSYHTAHPKLCPRTGHLVGWHYSVILPASEHMELTFTEWSPDNFEPVARKTFLMPDNELAPHDMALTENCIIMIANSMEMNKVPYLLGMKAPAASMTMNGRANVVAHVYPRPTSKNQFEPFQVEVPPCFVIHWSHAYEDEKTGNIVAFFSGWPPSDSASFLGAWGGYCPNFKVIPPTNIWRLEVDPETKKFVDLSIAPGSMNSCAEHIVVHPNFQTRAAENVYAIVSNVVGDSSAPVGYGRHCVESGSNRPLEVGEYNYEIDAYWFGSRRFTDEPLVVPKKGGNPEDERDAYLLGMVFDAVEQRSFLSVFDLKQDLKEGPVCKLWLKSHIPQGLHGCFAADGPGTSSVFC